MDTLQILKLLCAHITYYFREKQYRQHTYNVTLRRARVTNVAMEKVISTIYSECVFVALGIHHAICMRRIFVCGLSGSTIFFHLISLMARFSKEKLLNMKFVF